MHRYFISALAMVVILIPVIYYEVEPWAATFIDDGPYRSTSFAGPVETLVVHSRVELRRLWRPVYMLESRIHPNGTESVLVLRGADGQVEWARVPVKPEGELGLIFLRRVELTWYGGWRISISPEHQEGGWLYLSALGSFRFFNHSW